MDNLSFISQMLFAGLGIAFATAGAIRYYRRKNDG